MLERVREKLSTKEVHNACKSDSLDSLIKYVTIYFGLAQMKVDLPVIPEFLKIDQNLSDLTQRVTTKGLTTAESSQVLKCIELEIGLHTRKPSACKNQVMAVNNTDTYQLKVPEVVKNEIEGTEDV